MSTVPNRSELRAELGVWETATGKNRFTLSGPSSAEFLSVVILPDEKQILDFTPGRDSASAPWDLLTGQPVTRKMPFSSSFPPVFSPDGRRIACYGTTEGKRGRNYVWPTLPAGRSSGPPIRIPRTSADWHSVRMADAWPPPAQGGASASLGDGDRPGSLHPGARASTPMPSASLRMDRAFSRSDWRL